MIVKLEPAITAMVQAPAQQVLHCIQQTGLDRIDVIAGLQPDYAVRTALRATALLSKVIAVGACNVLSLAAIAAAVDGHVAEALDKCAMNAPELSATARAFAHKRTI